MSKCVVFILEGETEVEFYKKIVQDAHDKHPLGRFDVDIKYKCLKGVGSFKNEALRYFNKELKPKYPTDCEFTVVFCSDTDAFEIQKNPPVEWTFVTKEFEENGAKKIIHIQAKHCIEDWFLYDEKGIISFLRLPKTTKIPKGDGYHRLQKLFNEAHKVYYKGMKSNGLIKHLDLSVIMNVCDVKKRLNPLYKELGVKI